VSRGLAVFVTLMALLAAMIIAGTAGGLYKIYERADCVSAGATMNVGIRWSLIGGCEYQNPVTGMLVPR